MLLLSPIFFFFTYLNNFLFYLDQGGLEQNKKFGDVPFTHSLIRNDTIVTNEAGIKAAYIG